MSAIPEEFIKQTTQLSEEVTRPFPGSTKIYVQGSRPDIRVPMRQVQQADTAASFGVEKNPPVTVYDTSGLYSDPAADIDLMAGLPDVRAGWIGERNDTEQLEGPSSAFGHERQTDAELPYHSIVALNDHGSPLHYQGRSKAVPRPFNSRFS